MIDRLFGGKNDRMSSRLKDYESARQTPKHLDYGVVQRGLHCHNIRIMMSHLSFVLGIVKRQKIISERR